jgi:pheromone shutdown protein TraB
MIRWNSVLSSLAANISFGRLYSRRMKWSFRLGKLDNDTNNAKDMTGDAEDTKFENKPKSELLVLQDSGTGHRFFVLGTQHDHDYTNELTELFDRVKPNSVMVELDELRLQALNRVRAPSGLAFYAVIKLADERGIPLVCGDLPMHVTLPKSIGAIFIDLLPAWRNGLLRVLRVFNLEDNVLRRETVRSMNKQLKTFFPTLYKHLVFHRDLYMIESLKFHCPGPVVVGVVGLGHLDGIQRHWDTHPTRDPESSS